MQYQHVYKYDESSVLLVYAMSNHNWVCRNCIHPYFGISIRYWWCRYCIFSNFLVTLNLSDGKASLCNTHILNLYINKMKFVVEIIWELQGLGFLHFGSNGALVLSWWYCKIYVHCHSNSITTWLVYCMQYLHICFYGHCDKKYLKEEKVKKRCNTHIWSIKWWLDFFHVSHNTQTLGIKYAYYMMNKKWWR